VSEILPRHYVYGIVIFTLFVVAGVTFVSTFADGGGSIDEDRLGSFNKTFNKMDSLSSTTADLRSGVEDAETDFGAFGVLNSLISGAWNTLRLLFSSLGFMDGVFSGLETEFGVPAFIGVLIGLLAVLLIAFAIYSAIFQRDI